MKKICLTITLIVLSASTALFSQGKISLGESGLIKKIEKANSAIENPKKSSLAATWVERGDAMMAAASAVPNTLYEMSDTELTILYGKAEAEPVTIENQTFVKKSYPYFDAYLDANGTVKGWVMKKEIYPNALQEAIASYNKAAELDSDGKSAAKIGKGLENAHNLYYNLGSRLYAIRMYNESGDLLAKAFKVTQMPGFTSAEANPAAAVSHDAGLAYFYGKNFDKSAEYLKAAISNSYSDNGDIYSLLANVLVRSANGRSDEERTAMLNQAREILEKGMRQHPANDAIIETLTDVYDRLDIDLNQLAPVIREAINDNPDNAALWNSLARVYEGNKDYDNAISAYEKVVSLVPEESKAQFIYAIGYVYAQKAQEVGEEYYNATYASDSEREKVLTNAMNLYMKGLEHAERAFEMQPDNTYFVNLLKVITFRLRTTSDEMNAKYEKYDALYKQLTNQ